VETTTTDVLPDAPSPDRQCSATTTARKVNDTSGVVKRSAVAAGAEKFPMSHSRNSMLVT